MRVHLCVALCFFSAHAAEYLYPVGYNSEADTVYLMYQKTMNHIELWEWDPHTKYAQQLLMSRYSPAGLKLLPDGSGFSFIDNGILKVKSFIKRSPRTIEFDRPLSNVELVHWIDSKNFYTAAQLQDYSGIFAIDWDGCVQEIAHKEGIDYLYPQKIENELYCIERTEQGEHFLCRMNFQPHATPQKLYSFENQAVAFLHMRSADLGYVTSFKPALSKREKVISFEYVQILKKEAWESEKLFSFNIPTSLLTPGPTRLYESILPLLPYHKEDDIYFVSAENSILELYHYSLKEHIQKKLVASLTHIFGVSDPFDSIYLGGQLGGLIDMVEGVYITLKKLT